MLPQTPTSRFHAIKWLNLALNVIKILSSSEIKHFLFFPWSYYVFLKQMFMLCKCTVFKHVSGAKYFNNAVFSPFPFLYSECMWTRRAAFLWFCSVFAHFVTLFLSRASKWLQMFEKNEVHYNKNWMTLLMCSFRLFTSCGTLHLLCLSHCYILMIN